ncbi:MAG: LacI family DNA-binding transcriptional regulator [Tepidisphaerales bacterium]
MVTLKEVAEAAGVSITTASRVLNGVKFAERIGAARAAHVREVARRLGYVTNYHHRSLRMGRTESVGVVLDVGAVGVRRPPRALIGNPYFTGLIAGMEAAAIHAGYGLVLMGPRPDQRALPRAIEAILERRVDGVIVPGVVPRPDWDELLSRHAHLPIGLIDYPHPTPLPGVTFDHAGGMSLLVRHLAEQGHRRLAWLSPSRPGFVETLRESAIRETASALGCIVEKWQLPWDDAWQEALLVDPPTTLMNWGEASVTQAWAAARARPRGEQPTAALCYNDQVAVGAVRALQKLGVRVPEHFSVTGFDNVESAWSLPGITTVDHQFIEMGQRVCELVIARSHQLSEKPRGALPPAESVRVPAKLVVRESTGPAPAG